MLIYSTVSKKAAVVNIPNNVGQIFQSLGRVEKIATVYEEKGINDFSKEVEKLLNVEIPYNVVINIEQFTKLTDMIGGMRIFLASPINYVDENDVRYLLPSGVVTLDTILYLSIFMIQVAVVAIVFTFILRSKQKSE